jgi:hypothetical protein
MIPDAFMAHASPGRLRIRIPSKKGDEGFFISSQKQFEGCPGVLSVEVNPLTGSMLFLHQTVNTAISEYARSHELFTLQEQSRYPAANPANFRRDIRQTFKNVDQQVQTMTSGELDLGGFVIAVLVGTGVLQILTGNAAAIPWYVAFGLAYSIFLQSKEAKEAEE